MNRADYLRMLDSNADPQDIGKMLLQRESVPSQPVNWKADEHLETDFVTAPPMPIKVFSDVVDQPPTQRMYGAPVYDASGDMRCRCCGNVMARTSSNSGEGIAVCANVGCDANGFAYAEGSYLHNPHRVRP